MNLKPALEIKDQSELLQKRGLGVEDFDEAYNFLLSNNYYRLNVYFHNYMDDINHFIQGTTFKKIQSVYENDQFLRNKLLILLEPIEIKFKSCIAYYLGIKYGSDCFYQSDIFSKRSYEYEKIRRNFDREITTQSGEPVIQHHLLKYAGVFPIWVVVEFLSFNSISRLFTSLSGNDKKIISDHTFGVNEFYLESWIHSLCVLRNVCAHYGHLHQRKFSIKPRLFKEWECTKNDNLYALFQILHRLSEEKTWDEFIKTIVNLEKLNNVFFHQDYGFNKKFDNYY